MSGESQETQSRNAQLLETIWESWKRTQEEGWKGGSGAAQDWLGTEGGMKKAKNPDKIQLINLSVWKYYELFIIHQIPIFVSTCIEEIM